jgi:hypothetical protein
VYSLSGMHVFYLLCSVDVTGVMELVVSHGIGAYVLSGVVFQILCYKYRYINHSCVIHVY